MTAVLLALCLSAPAHAQEQRQVQPTGMELQGFAYPFPVGRFDLDSQGQRMAMAYMDARPAQPNGRTIVLLHGKNFCGAAWEGTIQRLQAAGYRVIVPDQIGFCRSTKPQGYQFSLHQLAANTRALLRHLDAGRVTMVGHSMGGMLTMRHALLYPEDLNGIVLVNPIGLEDWQMEGVRHRIIDQWYAGEQRVNFAGIKAYQQSTYYAGEWCPEYDRWVEMLAGMYVGEGRERVAWNQAQTSDMVYTQPVVHEFGRIRVPTLLMIGERDNTAIGKAFAPPEVQARLGDYAALGPRTAERIPGARQGNRVKETTPILAQEAGPGSRSSPVCCGTNIPVQPCSIVRRVPGRKEWASPDCPGARLVRFPELGHSPQIQDPARFHAALLEGLETMPRP